LPRDPEVPFLWGHQDRILERYENEVDTADLALELPTGTGKTLIGLLIAEWRRRSRQERVLYLCPTRQLVHQVGAQAARYGIEAKVCLRPEYDGLDRWQGGDAVAISTYSALFNYRPRFTAPQTLILDDAHAAENYVADHWTVTVSRDEMAVAYSEIVELLGPHLDRLSVDLLAQDEPRQTDRAAVELVPLPRWWPLEAPLREILETAVQDTDQWYAWDSQVRDGLSGCSLLVSWDEIVFRPLVPATGRQEQFTNCEQRLYMSATLGSGGDLERIFGVRRIERLPAPEEWEQHSTGRRLFLLPSASLEADEMEEVVTAAVKAAGRALVLVPTHAAGEERRASLELDGVLTLGSGDVEESLEPFTAKEEAALVLANRYDGIDLPGDECRLLVLDGLPVAVNLLERFLYQRLSVTSLLSERIRTRLTQGVGRATRGEGDWCAVLVASRGAYDFCARGEVRELLHPELQGEIRFGLDQSRDREAAEFRQLLDVLLEHGEEWQEADEQIRQMRDEARRGEDPATPALERAVAHEIDFTYSMWEGNYPNALESAVAAADALEGDPVAPYRAWWLYQAGTAAWMAYTSFGMEEMMQRSRELFRRAAAAGRSVHWFAELAWGQLGEGGEEPDVNTLNLQVAERIQTRLRSIGFHGQGFAVKSEKLRDQLGGTDSSPWEEGVTQLGALLGFDASHPGGQNTPDSVWLASEQLAIVWEIKSEENADGDIGARTVQQTAGHEAWARANRPLAEDAEVLVVLVTDRLRLGEGAELHFDGVCVASLADVRRLGEQAIATLRQVRALGQEADDHLLRSRQIESFDEARLHPRQLVERLRARPLSSLA
jgi:hypothetical protein